METPARAKEKDSRPRLSAEEKRQLLANLDLEGASLSTIVVVFNILNSLVFFSVHHRTRQFQETLAQALENFRNHQEGQVMRVPRPVRAITMREFADKYNGDIGACLRGLQRERQGGEPTLDLISKKRKWKETGDPQPSGDAESPRAPKTGLSPLKPLLSRSRITVDIARVASPVKMDAARLLKARLNKTPRTVRPFLSSCGLCADHTTRSELPATHTRTSVQPPRQNRLLQDQ